MLGELRKAEFQIGPASRALAGLAQEQEPGGTGGATRGRTLPESHTKSFLYVRTERAPIPTPS